jgi:hypothetical protein
VASIGVALAGMTTRASMACRQMTIVYEIQHLTARRRSPYPSARLPPHSALAPGGRCFSYSCDIGAPRPTRSRTTMTGSRFPGSRVIASDHLPRDLPDPQWYIMVVSYPPTVAGAAADLCTRAHAPHSLG